MQYLIDFQHLRKHFLRSAFLFILFNICTNTQAQKSPESNEAAIDIVFCLDLSGSTNGLIDNFRESIWSVINQVQLFKPQHQLRIGVVGFSRPSFGKNNAYVKILSKLTPDFDHMAAELWKLKPEVEKGDQFVSNALQTVGNEMNWSKSKKAIKMVFLIGNGNVDTGSGDYRSVVISLMEKDIQVIPVYCLRSKKTTEETGWQQIGFISGHQYETIWVLKKDPVVKPLPDNGKLIELSATLNSLVIPFTKNGIEAFSEIQLCDNKAKLADPVAFENRLYYRVSDKCTDEIKSWDLVSGPFYSEENLLNLDLSLLADSLKKISVKELLIKIQQNRETQKKVLIEIKKLLPVSRQEYINELVSRKQFDNDFILEKVILKSVNKIVSARGINVK